LARGEGIEPSQMVLETFLSIIRIETLGVVLTW